jgi:hypothetical protein
MKSYAHKAMRTEIRSISGYYTYLGEMQLDVGGRRVYSFLEQKYRQ